jgi:hypothetical protein
MGKTKHQGLVVSFGRGGIQQPQGIDVTHIANRVENLEGAQCKTFLQEAFTHISNTK